MSGLFGTEYFAYIAAAYGITFVVLMLLIIWVLTTYAKRKRDIALLESVFGKRGSR